MAPAALLLGALYLLAQVARPARVTVSWETGSEQDMAGFNLYRGGGDGGEGGDAAAARLPLRVNPAMVWPCGLWLRIRTPLTSARCRRTR